MGGGQHPTGTRCREFLKGVRTFGHHFVSTPKIREEWKKHQLEFARRWQASMVARRQVCWVQPPKNESFMRRLKRVKATKREQAAMLKDLRLICAAIATDQAVTSLDDEARQLFTRASSAVAELKAIVWVNPDRPAEDPIGWLERGARADRERMLGWVGQAP